jgi:hypothetical protein
MSPSFYSQLSGISYDNEGLEKTAIHTILAGATVHTRAVCQVESRPDTAYAQLFKKTAFLHVMIQPSVQKRALSL